ncbi:MAG TPA: xanthine dehydrogenase small subunit [Bacteroidota bacterium]|nr:xanthine dehydrogenase small subunit [Bacteroidota bacterium]
MRSTITFLLDGKAVEIDFARAGSEPPTTTLLEYLRSLPSHRGVKEGCAEGDCGACTVVIAEPSPAGTLRYRAIDSCLVFLPMIDGKQVITVENLRSPEGSLHPVQQAIVSHHGSQCGFCTPGFLMSMFALYKSSSLPSGDQIMDALGGNLCRCTGYRPIVDASRDACALGPHDHFSARESGVLELLAASPHDAFCVRSTGRTYIRPASLDEVFAALEEYPGAALLAGGTDVALRVTKRHESLDPVIDIGAVPELKASDRSGGDLLIGAGVPLADLPPLLGDAYTALSSALNVFASSQVKNCATIGGNLGTASPIGDLAPVLMAYRACVVLRSVRGSRRLPLEEFLTGYRRNALGPGELVAGVALPSPRGAFVRSYKVSRRRQLDIATLSAGFRLELDGAGSVAALVLAYGGMAERTERAEHAERALAGRVWSREVVEEAARSLEADFTPITDVRGSAEFRTLAAKNLMLRFWDDSKRGIR